MSIACRGIHSTSFPLNTHIYQYRRQGEMKKNGGVGEHIIKKVYKNLFT